MAAVKGKNTKPELKVRQFLHRLGFRYRLHDKALPGKPDLVFPKYNTALFINGCFWHGHEGCKDFRIPKTRSEWWEKKIHGNIERDLNNQQKLLDLGWSVRVIWECEIDPEKLSELSTSIKSAAAPD